MIRLVVLLILIYLFNIVDYCQTVYAISNFGLGVELNPIARFFFEHDRAWSFKLVVTMLFLIAIGIIVKIDRKQIWAVYFLTAFYFLLIVHNFFMLVQMGIF